MRYGFLVALWGGCVLSVSAVAAPLVPIFEPGKDSFASNWTFTSGHNVSDFLDLGFGGISQTHGLSPGFNNHSPGSGWKWDDSMSLYRKLNPFVDPTRGDFEIVDNFRVLAGEFLPGVFKFHWQARDNHARWQDLGIDKDLGDPFRIAIKMHPGSFTYDATVASVTSTADLLDWGSVTSPAFDQDIISSSPLSFVQASGETSARLSNIRISGAPEPEKTLLITLGIAALFSKRRRKAGQW